jgi:hypothetical protein
VSRARCAIRTLALLAALATAACLETADLGPLSPVTPQSMTILQGNDRTFTLGITGPEPFTVAVRGAARRPATGASVIWRVIYGAGEFRIHPDSQPVSEITTTVSAAGVTSAFFLPSAVGRIHVSATVPGMPTVAVIFEVRAMEHVDAMFRMGHMFDCGDPEMDPTQFTSSGGGADVIVSLGAKVAFEYDSSNYEGCQARVVSTSMPEGAEPFDGGVLLPGQRATFIASVTGTWVFTDAHDGGRATVTVLPPP